MRLCMLRSVERPLELHRLVAPTLFVDDLSAECTSPDKVIKVELGGFIESVAEQIEASEMELSRKKSGSRRAPTSLEGDWRRRG